MYTSKITLIYQKFPKCIILLKLLHYSITYSGDQNIISPYSPISEARKRIVKLRIPQRSMSEITAVSKHSSRKCW